uniref:Alpha/beta hydrolase fold-3 domain-containing protein n=1 Tax=Ciona intestinalis TaxID=7719 RepID=H2XLT4_CIOIN
MIKKSALTFAVLFALFAYLVHSPIPAEVHDPLYFQLLVDVLALSEFLSLFYMFKLNHLADGMKVENEMLGGVETVIITPRNFTVLPPKGFQERKKPGPAVVYFHGGGWVFANLSKETSMHLLVDFAEETGFVVMAPEYRLAPEHPFPAPYDDCMNSTISFMKSSKRFNVDPKKLILSGDSAGGNLAMAVYIGLIEMQASDPTVELPAMQALIYPILQMINYLTPSHVQNQKFMFSADLIPKFWLAYIGLNDQPWLGDVVARNSHVDKSDVELIEKWNLVSPNLIPDKLKLKHNDVVYDDTLDGDVRKLMKQMILNTKISPLLASNEIISKIKKTLVLVCEYDPLRDDGIILHERIKALGGSVELQYLPNSLHATASLGAIFKNTYYGCNIFLTLDVSYVTWHGNQF